jgi:hypothetical protein
MAKTNARIGILTATWKRKNNNPLNVLSLENESDTHVKILGAWYGN